MANITRFDPFTNLVRFDPFRTMDEFFGVPSMRWMPRDLATEPDIRMDITEDDKAYHVKAEVPGAKKEDIHVAIDGNQVSITAELKKEKEEKKGEKFVRSERYYGMQARSFTLMHDVDEKTAEAKYKDGILELVLPKKNGGAAKELTVQ